jgi:hypothetical protein
MSPYRKAAARKLAIGVGLFIMAFVWVFVRGSAVVETKGIAMKIVSLLFLGFLITALRPFFEGFIGLLFGMPIKDFTAMMDTRPLWQRIGVGVFLVVFTLGVFGPGLGYFLVWVCDTLSR